MKKLKKLKKPRKISIKGLKLKAWGAMSRYIRTRDKRCVTCGSGIAEHCGHYLRNGERNAQLGGNALWFDERNFGGQCAACNLYRNGEPTKFAIFLEYKHRHGILQELSDLRNKPKKWTREEIIEVEKKFNERAHNV